ncbi:MAG: signal peptidase II [Sphaerochaeta sp.]|jgi:signal peptidase II|nr:signal peptidase II [Sphaerochaeta sp.]MDX9915998.1 signal peptidase II [Sphaerochaeta sp.]
MQPNLKKRLSPFILTLLVIAIDQLSKAWIVAAIAENTVGYRFLGDFLAIIHVRNTAIAFSMGVGLPSVVKILVFILLPLLLVTAVIILMVGERAAIKTGYRWILALFLGGGVGNLIDRIFRSFRVVDFISVKVYGFLGFERWPTFNVADASLVVSGILLAAFLIFDKGDDSDV